MSLRRFYFSGPLGEVSRIDGDLFHHVRDVCRFGVGDRFEILPGDGRAVEVEILDVAKREMRVRTLGERELPRPTGPRVTLALSLPKLPKFDWIAEKCVELGVHEIRPFVSEFSFLRTVKEISPARTERWRKLVEGATQQSGRGDLMSVKPAVTFDQILEAFKQCANAEGLFPYEGTGELGLHLAIEKIKSRMAADIWIFVGSEGGFSAGEVERFRAAGLPPVTLGQQILRVETACLALVSIIKYETRGLA